MKKYYKKILLLIALLFPGVVFAAKEINYDAIDEAYYLNGEFSNKGIAYFQFPGGGCISLKDGEYIITEEDGLDLSEDFFCLDNATVTLDLNGKEIYSTNQSGVITGDSVDLTITGDGVIENGDINSYSINLTESDLTIENGTFFKIGLDYYSNVHILDGKFNGTIEGRRVEEIIIDGGTFNSNVVIDESDKVVVNKGKFSSSGESFSTHDTKNIVINDGEFKGNIPVSLNNAEFITINGGKYLGKESGLSIYDMLDKTKVQIKGGHFKATGEGVSASVPYWGAIVFGNANDIDKDYIQTWIADGYEYSPVLTSSKFEDLSIEMIFVYSQPEISVARIPQITPEKDKEAKEEPKQNEIESLPKTKEPIPPTIDNILLYIGTFIISIGATIFIVLKSNKKGSI